MMFLYDVDSNEVFRLLVDLDMRKAVGPDKISNFILNCCAAVLAEPLALCVDRCFKSGTFLTVLNLHASLLFLKEVQRFSLRTICQSPCSLLVTRSMRHSWRTGLFFSCLRIHSTVLSMDFEKLLARQQRC